MAFPAWARPVEEVLRHHGVGSVEQGLRGESLEALRQKYGYNELEKTPATPLWKLILEQFNDTLVKVPPPPPAAATCRAAADAGAVHSSVRMLRPPAAHMHAGAAQPAALWTGRTPAAPAPPRCRFCCWRPPCRLGWHWWRTTPRSRACAPSWSRSSL